MASGRVAQQRPGGGSSRSGRGVRGEQKQQLLDLKKQLGSLRDQCQRLQQNISGLRGEVDNKLHDVAAERGLTKGDLRLNQRRILRGHYGKIYAMQWQPTPGQGDLGADNLVSASQDGKLIVWNGRTTNKIKMIPLKSSWVMTCAYAPSGNLVACGGLDNLCSVFALDSDEAGGDEKEAIPQHELRSHEGYLSSCRFLNDSKIITSSGDSTCMLWDMTRNKPIRTFDAHTSDVMSVSIKHQSNVFVSGSCDTSAKIFDLTSGECHGTFSGHQADINTVEWFPDGNSFGSGSDDSNIKLYDQRAYRQLNTYSMSGVLAGVTSLCFSSSGKYIFAGFDDNPYLCVYDTLLAESVQLLNHLQKRVSCVGMQCHGYALCTGSWDYNLRIWA